MGLSYDVALLTGAELVTLTGVTDLANLEADSELDVDTVVLDAQREVYERLYENGLSADQLSAMTNEAWLKRRIASLALARLAIAHAGLLSDGQEPEALRERALHGVDRFRPQFAAATATPRRSGEGIPSVGHASEGLVYGIDPNSYEHGVDYLRSNLPQDLG